MPTTLIITNDFPPRIGGIESFIGDLCELLDGDVVVYASGPPGGTATDAVRRYPVVRDGSLLLPIPRVAERARIVLRRFGATRVLFGAAAPLGLLAPSLRRAGAQVVVGLTHGHETWWATLPGARQVLRRIGEACDHLTTISEYTSARIRPALCRGADAPAGTADRHQAVQTGSSRGRASPVCGGWQTRCPKGFPYTPASLASGGSAECAGRTRTDLGRRWPWSTTPGVHDQPAWPGRHREDHRSNPKDASDHGPATSRCLRIAGANPAVRPQSRGFGPRCSGGGVHRSARHHRKLGRRAGNRSARNDWVRGRSE